MMHAPLTPARTYSDELRMTSLTAGNLEVAVRLLSVEEVLQYSLTLPHFNTYLLQLYATKCRALTDGSVQRGRTGGHAAAGWERRRGDGADGSV